MLAEMTGLEQGSMITGMVFGGIGCIAVIFGLFKKQEVQVDQPVSITITEELHRQFASKAEFDRHLVNDDKTHNDLFSKIGGVERGANGSLDRKIGDVQRELSEQGKSIAGLEKETQLQNQNIAAIQTDIKVILQRIPRRE